MFDPFFSPKSSFRFRPFLNHGFLVGPNWKVNGAQCEAWGSSQGDVIFKDFFTLAYQFRGHTRRYTAKVYHQMVGGLNFVMDSDIMIQPTNSEKWEFSHHFGVAEKLNVFCWVFKVKKGNRTVPKVFVFKKMVERCWNGMVEIEWHLYAHLCGWQVAKISDGARGFFGVCFLLKSPAFKLSLRVLNLSQSHRFGRAHQKLSKQQVVKCTVVKVWWLVTPKRWRF